MREVAAAIGPISTSGLGPATIGAAVVLGDPVAVVAEPVGQLGEVEVLRSASAPVEPSEIGRLVQDAEHKRSGHSASRR